MDLKDHVDYVPTVFVYTKKVDTLKQAQKEERERRLEHRRALVGKENQPVAEDPQGDIANDGPTHDVCTQTSDSELCDIGTQSTNSDQHDAISPGTNGQQALLQQPLQVNNMSMVCYVPVKSQSPGHPRFGCDIIKENDDATKFYTSLSSWALFQFLLSYLTVYYPSVKPNQRKISHSDGLLMVLMRLRLNLRIEDLSYRFGITLSTASNIFQKWIEVMFIHLKFLIKWPTQEAARANMPQIFKDLYPRTRCIIDCSEIFIERPCAYQARAQTYSSYKKDNTVKFLIGITPCGAISFLFKCWGGRATDRCITPEQWVFETY